MGKQWKQPILFVYPDLDRPTGSTEVPVFRGHQFIQSLESHLSLLSPLLWYVVLLMHPVNVDRVLMEISHCMSNRNIILKILMCLKRLSRYPRRNMWYQHLFQNSSCSCWWDNLATVGIVFTSNVEDSDASFQAYGVLTCQLSAQLRQQLLPMFASWRPTSAFPSSPVKNQVEWIPSCSGEVAMTGFS